MKTLKIFDWCGNVVCQAKVCFGRWQIADGKFKVYNYMNELEFFCKYDDSNSWRAE